MILFISDHSASNHDSGGEQVVFVLYSADSAEFPYILINPREKGWGSPILVVAAAL